MKLGRRGFAWLATGAVAATLAMTGAARAEGEPLLPGATADFTGVTLGGQIPEGDAQKSQLHALIDGTDELRGLPGIVLVQRDSEEFGKLHDIFTREGYLADAVRDLIQRVHIPGNLRIVLGDCGEINATYIPSEHAIAMCHEVIAYYADNFRAMYPNDPARVGVATVSSTLFTLYHEIGHAFFDIFGLPNLGSEEDAADRIASLLLLERGGGALAQVMEGARGLDALGKLGAATWDVHAFGEQRFYNVACMAIGSLHDASAQLTGADEFNEGRVRLCPREFDRAQASLELFLAPHRPAVAAAPVLRGLPMETAVEPVLRPLPETAGAPALRPLPEARRPVLLPPPSALGIPGNP